MKTTITNLPKLISSVRLMEVSENQLDVEMTDYWMRDTEKEYNSVIAKLDKISAKGKGYFIYVWYDVSGFDYWKKDGESNYAQISITFDNTEINSSQAIAIENKLNKVIDKVLRVIEI